MQEQRKIKCPFCNQGELESTYFPPAKMERKSVLSGKGYFQVSNERLLINSPECPSCHKSKKEIEKFFRDGKSVSMAEAARKAKELGLPMKI